MDTRKRSTASKSDSVSYHVSTPNFDDPPEFVDDIPDEELLQDILKNKPNDTTGMEAVIILDGLPTNIQPGDRFDKLKVFVRKLIGQHTKSNPTTDIINEVFAVDENGTQGFAFFEFNSQEIAQRALETMNNLPLDKQHVLTVDLFTDFDKYINYTKEWVEPEMRPYKDVGNLQEFMEEEDCCDQYICIYGRQTGNEVATVYLNTPVEPTIVETRLHWTDRYAMWSPLGSYLATFHQKGVALWGSKDFKQITRFAHKDVITASFSPKERFILTVRNKPDYLSRDDESMILWDLITSARKKDFSWDSREPATLKWSPDENFYAVMGKNDSISVYETKNFTLLGKESIKIPGVADFSWSPSQNYLAYWVREATNVPARLGLLELPSKAEKRTKQLFSVTECQFYWQKNGDYMAVKVHRYKKKTKKENSNEFIYAGLFFNLEIFTLTGRKEVPVESIEIKDQIVDLAWEPNGSKLVVLTIADTVYSVSFYSGRQEKQFELTKKMSLRHKADKISWSPMGQFLVLHTSASGSVGYLVFIDAADMIILQDIEHFLLDQVHWDPTGRYLAATTSGHNKKDNGYTLFTFQGRFIRTEKLDGLHLFSWRPRPPTLLTADKQKEIRKNIKKYAPEFEMRDRMQLTKASKEVSERRKKQMDDFDHFLRSRQRILEQGRRKLLDLRGGVDTESLDQHPEDLAEEELEIIQSITRTSLD